MQQDRKAGKTTQIQHDTPESAPNLEQGSPKNPPQLEQSVPRPTGRPTAPAAGDARGDAQKQEQNREHLGVDEDHETPEMKKGHRGTFP